MAISDADRKIMVDFARGVEVNDVMGLHKGINIGTYTQAVAILATIDSGATLEQVRADVYDMANILHEVVEPAYRNRAAESTGYTL